MATLPPHTAYAPHSRHTHPHFSWWHHVSLFTVYVMYVCAWICMCVHVCMCVYIKARSWCHTSSIIVDFVLRFGAFYWAEAHWFGQTGWPLNPDILLSPPPCAGIAGTYCHAGVFTCVLEMWSQVIMLMQQVLWPLSHPPSLSLHNHCHFHTVLIFNVLHRKPMWITIEWAKELNCFGRQALKPLSGFSSLLTSHVTAKPWVFSAFLDFTSK